jgi:hypothetical protein
MLEKFAAPRTSSHLVGVAQRGIYEYRDVVAGTMRASRHWRSRFMSLQGDSAMLATILIHD